MAEPDQHARDYFDVTKNHQLYCWEYLLKRVEVSPHHHVLDLGCGTGDAASIVAKTKATNGLVTACDPDAERIRVAKQNHADVKNLKFVNAKASEFLVGLCDNFDVIYSNLVLQWMSDCELECALKGMYHALKDGCITGHVFAAAVPPNMKTIKELLPEVQQSKFEVLFRPLDPNKLKTLAEKVGFETTAIVDYPKISRFETISDYLKWLDATFHGDLNFKEAWLGTAEKPQLDTLDDGAIKHHASLFFVAFRKPFNERNREKPLGRS